MNANNTPRAGQCIVAGCRTRATVVLHGVELCSDHGLDLLHLMEQRKLDPFKFHGDAAELLAVLTTAGRLTAS